MEEEICALDPDKIHKADQEQAILIVNIIIITIMISGNNIRGKKCVLVTFCRFKKRWRGF